MSKGFIRQEDVQARYDQTVMMYDGMPVEVRVNNNFPCGTVTIYPLVPRIEGTNQGTEINVDDPKFGTPFPILGFINHNRATYLLGRRPVKTTKEGLCDGTCRMIISPGDMSVSAIIRSNGFQMMLERKYPTIMSAAEKMRANDRILSMAFHPFMRLNRIQHMLTVEVWDSIVGQISPCGKKINPHPFPGIEKLTETMLKKLDIAL